MRHLPAAQASAGVSAVHHSDQASRGSLVGFAERFALVKSWKFDLLASTNLRSLLEGVSELQIVQNPWFLSRGGSDGGGDACASGDATHGDASWTSLGVLCSRAAETLAE